MLVTETIHCKSNTSEYNTIEITFPGIRKITLAIINVNAIGIKKYVGNNPKPSIAKVMTSQIIDATMNIIKAVLFFCKYFFIELTP